MWSMQMQRFYRLKEIILSENIERNVDVKYQVHDKMILLLIYEYWLNIKFFSFFFMDWNIYCTYKT